MEGVSTLKLTKRVLAIVIFLLVIFAFTGVFFTEFRGDIRYLTNPIPAPQPVKTDVTVGAYWWPHFGDKSPQAYPRLTWRESVFHPVLGEYDANDPYVVDWHIKWAVEHGVSFFVASFYEARLSGLVKSKYLAFMKYALLLDLFDIGGFCDPRNLPAVLDHLHTRYFNGPSYLKVESRPVLFIVEANLLLRYLSIDELRLAFERGRQDYKTKYGVEPYFVGVLSPGGFTTTTCIPTPTDIAFASIFDAVTIYNMPGIGGTYKTSDGKTTLVASYDDLVSSYPEATERQMKAFNKAGVRFIPHALPGFNNTLLFNHGVDNWLTVRPSATPEKFKSLLELMKAYVDPELKMLMVEAWNEFSEGSVIEPTQEFGFQYLDAILQVFTPASNEHIDKTPKSFATQFF